MIFNLIIIYIYIRINTYGFVDLSFDCVSMFNFFMEKKRGGGGGGGVSWEWRWGMRPSFFARLVCLVS